MSKITDFLNTTTSKDDLATTLRVLKEFKANESTEEWLHIPFEAWAKLEQLQEYLEYLVNGTELQADTLEYIAREEIDNG